MAGEINNKSTEHQEIKQWPERRGVHPAAKQSGEVGGKARLRRAVPYQMLNTQHVPNRILMTTDTVGGVWTYSMELARALGEHNVEVALASMGAPLSAEQRAEVRRIPNLEMFESRFKLEWMEDAWQEDIQRAGEWLLKLEQNLSPQVVHLNGYAHGALPWHAPTLMVGHSCVLSWWTAVKGEAAPAAWEVYRELVTNGLHAASRVIAPSHAMLSALERHYGALPGARVVPNGRDPELFTPGDKQEFIFTAGRLWDEAKNVAALGAVAPRLDWPVYMAGPSSHRNHGTLRCSNIRLLGHLSPRAIAPWYGRAPIYALPASYEPFGLTVLEAGLSGCALVLGDIESLRETWQDAALFVPPHDTLALKAALRGLIADPVRREFLGEQARLRALEFSPGRMAVGYLSAYSELTQKTAQEVPRENSACAL